jgi:hypothetical protein
MGEASIVRPPCCRWSAIPLLGLGLLPWAGCAPNETLKLQREITALKDQMQQKDNQLVTQRVTIEDLHKQLDECRGISAQDLAKIFYPEKVVIASLSGGEDYDGRPGDDGITVYLRPVDRDGDAIKVAGHIRIELYDLANPPDENLVGAYDFPVDEVSKLWYGKFATYHYTLRCPWRRGPPKHSEITIRAIFTDFLTKRVVTAQQVCTFKPAP